MIRIRPVGPGEAGSWSALDIRCLDETCRPLFGDAFADRRLIVGGNARAERFCAKHGFRALGESFPAGRPWVGQGRRCMVRRAGA